MLLVYPGLQGGYCGWSLQTWSTISFSSFLSLLAEAFVSLVTNDSYAAGAIALGKSLRDTHTQRRLTLLITDGVSQEMRWAGPVCNNDLMLCIPQWHYIHCIHVYNYDQGL